MRIIVLLFCGLFLQETCRTSCYGECLATSSNNVLLNTGIFFSNLLNWSAKILKYVLKDSSFKKKSGNTTDRVAHFNVVEKGTIKKDDDGIEIETVFKNDVDVCIPSKIDCEKNSALNTIPDDIDDYIQDVNSQQVKSSKEPKQCNKEMSQTVDSLESFNEGCSKNLQFMMKILNSDEDRINCMNDDSDCTAETASFTCRLKNAFASSLLRILIVCTYISIMLVMYRKHSRLSRRKKIVSNLKLKTDLFKFQKEYYQHTIILLTNFNNNQKDVQNKFMTLMDDLKKLNESIKVFLGCCSAERANKRFTEMKLELECLGKDMQTLIDSFSNAENCGKSKTNSPLQEQICEDISTLEEDIKICSEKKQRTRKKVSKLCKLSNGVDEIVGIRKKHQNYINKNLCEHKKELSCELK